MIWGFKDVFKRHFCVRPQNKKWNFPISGTVQRHRLLLEAPVQPVASCNMGPLSLPLQNICVYSRWWSVDSLGLPTHTWTPQCFNGAPARFLNQDFDCVWSFFFSSSFPPAPYPPFLASCARMPLLSIRARVQPRRVCERQSLAVQLADGLHKNVLSLHNCDAGLRFHRCDPHVWPTGCSRWYSIQEEDKEKEKKAAG